jgi:F420-dependent oxidoreductase-like protein
MRFGIDIAQQRVEFDDLVNRARFVEDLGFDGAWGFDHFVPMYGEGPGNCFEGMTTLAALATATSRIRLGLLVTGITYRHPSVLAAQALTVDHASHGRLELAVGAAWFEPEHRQLGIEFPPTGRRFDRLQDALEIFTRLFSGETVSYEGRQISLDRAQMRPTPVQRPHPPIWIGGSGRRRTLPLAARFADVWHTHGAPEQLKELSAEIDRLAEAAGRDPSSILRASSLSLSEPWDDVRRNAQAMRDVGIGYLVCGWPGEGDDKVEEFATRVMPELVG